MRSDTLFSSVAGLQGLRPWGTVLDAGTGRHSLGFVASLPTTSWTAVTADPARVRDLEMHQPRRANDRLLAGNWTDETLFQGEQFDTVLVDYLVGALEGFSPYFQDRFFHRLAPHCRGRIYVIGLEPYPDAADEGGRIVQEIARLRDACILLAGHRCYREYPRAWVVRALEAEGFTILHERAHPIRYGEPFVRGQLQVCRSKITLVDAVLRNALTARIENLALRARTYLSRFGSIPFGEDYVVAGERTENRVPSRAASTDDR